MAAGAGPAGISAASAAAATPSMASQRLVAARDGTRLLGGMNHNVTEIPAMCKARPDHPSYPGGRAASLALRAAISASAAASRCRVFSITAAGAFAVKPAFQLAPRAVNFFGGHRE